ncbi:XshC-Cox1-family protein [Crassaminicella thermophila]|uniref:XshC-Cox1-family protein n=1 Tax=Crassaminicella thermophila TaxID=2599308 RepID=A0A5C0SI14_CRATE|nr:XdhC/CoxI family protein [Crassaminicella thermophila]QEK13064.1 XshC-Cox1-family protein [Crassaminicella thermophila]
MEQKLVKELLLCLEENKDVALVTVVDAQGSSPRGKGSMMLVDQEGNLIEGTIGGGAIEEKAKEDALECINRGISKSVHYELNKSNKKDSLPMICGGSVDVFIKVFKSKDELLIVGAGHIGFKLSKMADLLGYRVVIIDDREEYACKERFPEADALIVGDIEKNLREYPIGEKTNIVIVSHGHKHDQEALEAVIDSGARYIGMIGSIKKVIASFEKLKKKGIKAEKLSKVHAPIGIDIGGETPEEISLSIMAEIQAVKYNKKGSFLKLHRECD